MEDPNEQNEKQEAALQKMIAALREWTEISGRVATRTITRKELAAADAKFKEAESEYKKAMRKPRKIR